MSGSKRVGGAVWLSDMNAMVDQARAVRAGEELDASGLRAYLQAQLDEDVGELEIKQFPGGHSNLTYLIRWPTGAGDQVREYVLRRPPYGSRVKRAHDMGREYRVLSSLAPVYPKAPRPVLFCQDEEVMGADFYLMDRVKGLILRRELPSGLSVDEVLARRLCEVLLDALIELHALDYQAIGMADLGKPAGYVERQVAGWTRRYSAAQTDDIAAVDQVAAWLADNLPSSEPATLIHNDFKFDNVILDVNDPTRIIGILDWEMCTLGDPLMDLGTSLAYWIEAGDSPVLQKLRFGPTALPGMMTRDEVAGYYAEKTGRSISDIGFYYGFGLFKTAVVVQQIYYRYAQGLTKDPRFAGMNVVVGALAEQALEAISRGRISW